MAKRFVIINESRTDAYDRPAYFVQLGLGLFWELSHESHRARQFATRAAASKMLVKTGKNREGWRVVAV